MRSHRCARHRRPCRRRALLADGRTAIGLIRLARPGMGDWVLVEAAGGGVGSLLVQLAANSGARVIGAAGNAAKRALARDLGAAVTVDYTTPGWTGAVRDATGGAGPTVAFDSVGVEIRGRAEALENQQPADGHWSGDIIRIHPRRIIVWGGINPDAPGMRGRDVT